MERIRSKKKTEKLVKKYLKYWNNVYGDNEWRIDVYHIDEKEVNPKTGRVLAAGCNANWQYKEAVLNFNINVLSKMEDWEVEETVLHELMHVFVNPMSRKPFSKKEDFVVTTLARLFMRTKYNG